MDRFGIELSFGANRVFFTADLRCEGKHNITMIKNKTIVRI